MNKLNDLSKIGEVLGNPLETDFSENKKQKDFVNIKTVPYNHVYQEREEYSKEKQEYQEEWMVNKFNHRKMVSKKNRTWLIKNSENPNFNFQEENLLVYQKIEDFFNDEGKRKWMIHIICNFLPLNKVSQVPKIPTPSKSCPFSNLNLTDIKNIVTGDRDKHIAFTGERTNVLLSAIAIQELYKFVMNYTHDFNSRNGQIINHCLDEIRMNN